MKFLFLYAEVTGYLMTCLQALQRHPSATEVRVYQALDLPETGYNFATAPLPVHDAIGRTAAAIWPEIEAYGPDVVYVSGWSFPEYLKLARRLRKRGATTIIGNDTPWYGTARQWLGALSSPFWLRPVFDWMWVPGPSHERFARRLSFSRACTRTGLLSADVDAFQAAAADREPAARKVLLSAGSFLPNKGMDRICEAFLAQVSAGVDDWDLMLVGAKDTAQRIPVHERIRVLPFVQPQEMPALFAQADAFVLASLRESWGVVVHEAAAAGLPLLLSERAGAVDLFLRDRYNGWRFDPFAQADLQEKMGILLRAPDAVLKTMGRRSTALAQQQHPEMWAQALVNMRLDASVPAR